MDLGDAIDTVVAHTRIEGGGNDMDDLAVITLVRHEVDHDELDLWLECDDLEPGEIEDAYRIVIDASDDEVVANID